RKINGNSSTSDFMVKATMTFASVAGRCLDRSSGPPYCALNAARKEVGMIAEPIVVTGSSGLIGRAVISRMAAMGMRPVRFDLHESNPRARADLRDEDALQRALDGAAGNVHLGAV